MSTSGSTSASSLLGSLVPNVYIDCITLETTGNRAENSNPHIEHSRERSQKLRNPQSLRVKLDLIIKERVGDSSISRWFDKIDFTKYLDILVYQSIDVKDTNYMLENDVNSSRPSFLKNLKYRLKEKKISALHEKVLSVERGIDKKTSTKITEDDLPSKLNRHYSYIDQDGNKIHDITYSVSFQVSNTNPRHLCYFAFCSIDLERLSGDYNLNLPDSSISNLTGRMASELVINNFKTLSQSQIFRDQSGQIWAGDIHQASNGEYKTGKSDSGNSITLYRESVPNYKVQDFRDLKNLDNFSTQFEDIERNLIPEISSQKNLNKIVLDLDRTNKSIFTDCFLSRDPNGNARFLFGLNFEKVVRTSSLFKSFFNNTDRQIVREILSKSRINELRLIRRRVKKNSDKIEEFEIGAVPEILAISGADFGGPLRSVSNDRAALEEIKIFHNGKELIRYFSGIDRGMSLITAGVYQYGIEIQLEDGTANYLKELLGKLYKTKDFLTTYLNLSLVPGNYNNESNKFSQRFSTIVRNIYSNNKPWQVSIQDYINVLGILSNKPFNQTKLTQKLYNVISPYTGGPRGIRFFSNLIQNLITKFENVLATHNIFPNHSNQQVNSQSVHRKSGVPRTKKITKYFNEVFDSDVVKFTGYDFLEESGISNLSEGNTLKVINGSDFINRTELEKRKYYTSVNEDINFDLPNNQSVTGLSLNDNALSYLSPSSVNVAGREPLILLKKEGGINKNVEKYQEIMFEAVNMNTQTRQPISPRTFSKDPPIGPNSIKPSDIKRKFNFSNTTLGQILTKEGVSFVSPGVGTSARLASDGLFSERVFGETKIGTEKFPILKHKAFCFDAEFSDEVDVQVAAKKVVEVKFTNDIFKKSLPILPSPTKISSYNLNQENNFVSTGVAVSVSANTKQEELKSSEGISTRKEIVKPPRYSDQELPSDCFDNEFSEPATVGLSPTQTKAVEAVNLKSAPIQTYSIFLDSVKPSAVTENFQNKETDFLQNTGNLIVFWTNYKNIMTIEALTGYETSWNGAIQIKSPIFQRMTYDIYKNSIGKNLLCRMIPYNNVYLGVKSPISSCDSGSGCIGLSSEESDFIEKMSLPVFHKYFIITPENKGLGRISLGKRELSIDLESPIAGDENEDINLSNLTSRLLNNLEKTSRIKREFVENNPKRILGE